MTTLSTPSRVPLAERNDVPVEVALLYALPGWYKELISTRASSPWPPRAATEPAAPTSGNCYLASAVESPVPVNTPSRPVRPRSSFTRWPILMSCSWLPACLQPV